MENACVLSRNEKTIDLLINAGGVVSVKCLTLHTKSLRTFKLNHYSIIFYLNQPLQRKKYDSQFIYKIYIIILHFKIKI